MHKGHCLVTIATGALNEAEADRAGLVPSHAYAVLDIRKVKVNILSSFMCCVKNLQDGGKCTYFHISIYCVKYTHI